MKVRVSLGTLFYLGMEHGDAEAAPGVAYVMQYSNSGCSASCAFCSQSSFSVANKELLSRILWPVKEVSGLLKALSLSPIRRVCLQTIIKKNFIQEAHELAEKFNSVGKDVSLSITPVPKEELIAFRDEGVDYLGVGLDSVTPRIGKRILKPYPWDIYFTFIKEGIRIFGRGRVVTHLIVGLGETYEDILKIIEVLHEMGSEISLFAFTPIKGTPMANNEPPSLRKYRFSQLALYLMKKGLRWRDFVVFRGSTPYIKSSFIRSFSEVSKAFLTRGCPGCNRPFYNEPPSKEPYNYPSKELLIRWRRNLEDTLLELVIDE